METSLFMPKVSFDPRDVNASFLCTFLGEEDCCDTIQSGECRLVNCLEFNVRLNGAPKLSITISSMSVLAWKSPPKAGPKLNIFVISIENKKLRNNVIGLLNKAGFGTQNLPDAFNWHCEYFWEHIDKNIRNREVKSCYDRLLKCVAIPILVSRSIKDYKNIARDINECS